MSPREPDTGIDIDGLIQSLGPLNNAYRAAVRSRRASGAEVLEVMWDAGEVLVRSGVRKPSPVAWAIYGKPGEPRRSYITRDFTCSCFRVRRFFPERSDIRGQLPALQSHNIFKLALPLLENRKYGLSGSEKQALLELMNSREIPARIRQEIAVMKGRRFAGRSSRGGSNRSIEATVKQVAARHEELLEITATRNRRRLNSLRKRVGDENLRLLARLCLALFSEEFKAPALLEDVEITGFWRRFYASAAPIAAGSVADRNRLRRKSGSIVFFEMAEMLSAAREGNFVEGGFGAT